MPDREFEQTTTIRLTEAQKDEIEALAGEMETSESEAWRRLLFIGRVLFSDQVALADALRPIPDIVDELDSRHPTPPIDESGGRELESGRPRLVCEECGYTVPTTGTDFADALEEYEDHVCDAVTISSGSTSGEDVTQ